MKSEQSSIIDDIYRLTLALDAQPPVSYKDKKLREEQLQLLQELWRELDMVIKHEWPDGKA
ncbi:hypothetical protein EUZ85_19820 [Hahella sp. KA22]|uniref:hypothetical protein n=1 Tax=Hahella sp. KA22 TaxID=1628392 RepID=UPI000FDD9A65|nr:hypothetical protein [Hahella sp. KA22]AZZ92852.1 hypothetical protein ENC22_17240 [Hahella sp. KA22]QAY56226.1 hypothetical protein EUZ85_19820 [Hahella sp. KA22]